MENYWISLGQVKTLSEAKDRIKRVKANIKYKIAYNKYKIKLSSFSFKIEKEKESFMGLTNSFPYYLYVKTPDTKYNWMFLA